MRSGPPEGIRTVLAWMAFPLIPALLGRTYAGGIPAGSDPRQWGWATWALQVGPLLGYGYLAGATLDLPDDPDVPRRWRLFSRRWAWVAIGPWIGFASAFVIVVVWSLLEKAMSWRLIDFFAPKPFHEYLILALLAWAAYGWLSLAWVAHRRGARRGRSGRSFATGLGVAFFFVGSLFGTFWAATALWRDYFFDRRVVPILLLAGALALMAGCTGPETVGEVRRRELFQALLMAWLLGLTLAWRWWSRPRSRPN